VRCRYRCQAIPYAFGATRLWTGSSLKVSRMSILLCHILPPRSRNTNRRHNETLLRQSTMICMYPSTLICLYPSYHAVLVSGAERACKTMFHVPRCGRSLYFVFASLSVLNHSGSVLVAAYSILEIAAAGSSGKLFCTHHGPPVLAMYSIA
jgi:hypothetical protein